MHEAKPWLCFLIILLLILIYLPHMDCLIITDAQAGIVSIKEYLLDLFFGEAAPEHSYQFWFLLSNIEYLNSFTIGADASQLLTIRAHCKVLYTTLGMCDEGLIWNPCFERLLQYNPAFFFRWYREHKVCLTCAKSNDGLELFRLYLSNNRKIWKAIQVYTALLHDNYTFRSHANSLNLRVEIQLLKLVDLEIVPHNDFILGPLGVGTTADKRHNILSVEHFNDADTAVQLPAQL